MKTAARNAQKKRSLPWPNGGSGWGRRSASGSETSRKSWLTVSATECAASASMAFDPPIAPTRPLHTAMLAFAARATYTVFRVCEAMERLVVSCRSDETRFRADCESPSRCVRASDQTRPSGGQSSPTGGEAAQRRCLVGAPGSRSRDRDHPCPLPDRRPDDLGAALEGGLPPDLGIEHQSRSALIAIGIRGVLAVALIVAALAAAALLARAAFRLLRAVVRRVLPRWCRSRLRAISRRRMIAKPLGWIGRK